VYDQNNEQFWFLHDDKQQQVIATASLRGPVINEDRFDTRTHDIPPRGFDVDFANNFAYYSQPSTSTIWRANVAGKDLGSRDLAFIPQAHPYQITLDLHRGVLYYAANNTDLWQVSYDPKNYTGLGFFHNPVPLAIGYVDQSSLVDIEPDRAGNINAVFFCNQTNLMKYDFDTNSVHFLWTTNAGIYSFAIDSGKNLLYVLESGGIFARRLSNPTEILHGDYSTRPKYYYFEDKHSHPLYEAPSNGIVLNPQFFDLDECRQPPDEIFLIPNVLRGTCPEPYHKNGLVISNGTSCQLSCVVGMIKSADYYETFTKTCTNGLFPVVNVMNSSAMCVDLPHKIAPEEHHHSSWYDGAGFIAGMVIVTLLAIGALAYFYRLRKLRTGGTGSSYSIINDKPLAKALRNNRDGQSLNFTHDENDD